MKGIGTQDLNWLKVVQFAAKAGERTWGRQLSIIRNKILTHFLNIYLLGYYKLHVETFEIYKCS
jgi:hypothetical protein